MLNTLQQKNIFVGTLLQVPLINDGNQAKTITVNSLCQALTKNY